MGKIKILTILKQYFIVVLIGAILTTLVITAQVYYNNLKPQSASILPIASKGVFDFSKVDFGNQKFIPLHGEVEFYWEKFLTPNDFCGNNPTSSSTLVLPTTWNNLIDKNKKVGANGYGTFRFQIVVPKPGDYCIKVKEFESAFQIWIDSTLYKGAGKVGICKKDVIPSWHRKEIYFNTQKDTVDVLLHISNFHHRKGGASEIILFGSAESIRKIKIIQSGIESFLLGVLLLLILYHLLLYHYRREDNSILFFSLFCISILLRVSTTGEKLILEILPFISWAFAIRIEYIALVLIAPSFAMFIHYMLPGSIPGWYRKIIFVASSILVGSIILLPTTLFTYATIPIISLSYFYVILMIAFIIRAVIKRKKNAIGLAFGSILFFGVVINDMLLYSGSIQSANLIAFGLIILLFTQTYLISRNNALAFRMVKKLSSQLEKHNAELEEMVLKRTKHLQASRNEIVQQKNKIESQAAALSQTNEKLVELDRFKKDVTNMMVHDLKNPLNNILGFLQIPELTEDYKQLMYSSGNEMQNLIQNILDVTKYEQTKLVVVLEMTSLKTIVDNAYRQNKYIINLKSIRFENNISTDIEISIDEDLIERVFANIISNATKYRNENGLISISTEMITEDKVNYCKVNLFNTGESIPADKLDTIFSGYSQVYAPKGEYQYSTGIGLAFCKMAIEAHHGKIGVVSNKDEGVTFWFTLPVDGVGHN